MNEADTWHGGRPQPRRVCVRLLDGDPAPSPILRVEVENFEIGPKLGGISGYS